MLVVHVSPRAYHLLITVCRVTIPFSTSGTSERLQNDLISKNDPWPGLYDTCSVFLGGVLHKSKEIFRKSHLFAQHQLFKIDVLNGKEVNIKAFYKIRSRPSSCIRFSEYQAYPQYEEVVDILTMSEVTI